MTTAKSIIKLGQNPMSPPNQLWTTLYQSKVYGMKIKAINGMIQPVKTPLNQVVKNQSKKIMVLGSNKESRIIRIGIDLLYNRKLKPESAALAFG
jgi:hypothetical protein